MTRFVPILALGASLVSAQTATQAQAPSTPRAPVAANSASSETALPAQTIGPDDLISITVFDCPELTRSFRVSSDGTLALPILGRIPATGLMPVQLEDKLAAELRRTQTMVDPIVNISVAEYRSKPVSVVGAVRSPLTFQAMSDSTLLDAIAKAGGLAPEAGPEILLTRKDGTGVQRIPVRSLIDSADPAVNVHLHGGEEIRVPEVGKIFVAGNVKLPGAFPMQDNSDTTLLKALALSQGTLPYSAKLAYIYRRDKVTNARTEIPVELKQIMDRKSPDIPVYPDDILYIPENHGKKLTMGALDRIAGVGQGVTTALAYHF